MPKLRPKLALSPLLMYKNTETDKHTITITIFMSRMLYRNRIGYTSRPMRSFVSDRSKAMDCQ